MLTTVQEFFYRSFQLDTVSWFLLIATCALAVYMIATIYDSFGTGMMMSPVMFFGSGLGHNLLRELQFEPTSDKVINAGFGFGAGLFVSGLLLVAAIWLMSMWRQSQERPASTVVTPPLRHLR